MAGIGFELKKLFVGRSAIRKIMAYAYAGIVCTGTMILAFGLLIGTERLANALGATKAEGEQLLALLIYAQGGSLLLCSLLQVLLSRFVADQICQKQAERVLPSLFGGAASLMVPGGLLFGLFLLRAEELPALVRLLSWGLFMELIMVWLQMSYMTAIHDYKRTLLGFGAGAALAAVMIWLFLASGLPVVPSVLGALVMGYGLMLVVFTHTLLDFFPPGKGSLFYFAAWLGKYPELVFVGLFITLGAFVHLLILRFTPLGETVAGVLHRVPGYDILTFYAYLVTLPSQIGFAASVEVDFYKQYRRYFGAVSEGGTIGQISAARGSMLSSLREEVLKLAGIQVFAVVFYGVLMRYFLEGMGFSLEMIGMFQVMCAGYGAYAVGHCLVLLQLYFDDRRSALLTSGLFFAVNSLVSLLTLSGPTVLRGLGPLAAGALMYGVGLCQLMAYTREIDFHIFCGQPLLVVYGESGLERFAKRLDRSAALRLGRASKWRRKAPGKAKGG